MKYQYRKLGTLDWRDCIDYTISGNIVYIMVDKDIEMVVSLVNYNVRTIRE